MKVAYIAGPFRSPSYFGIYQNVRHAERVALKYWKLGYAVFCPHTNTANFDGAIPKEHDHVWLEGDIEIMKRCDMVVAMSTWERSTGARAEVKLAQSLGMEVIFDTEDGEGYRTQQVEQEIAGVKSGVIRVVWYGKSEATADDAVEKISRKDLTQAKEAGNEIRNFLKAGRRQAGECQQFLKTSGFPEKMDFRRVRKYAKVLQKWEGGKSWWYLPTSEELFEKPKEGCNMQMLTERERTFQRAILAVQRRLIHRGKMQRATVRLSCLSFCDAEFQRLLDAIVAGGIATRETGKRGGEWYVSTAPSLFTERSPHVCDLSFARNRR